MRSPPRGLPEPRQVAPFLALAVVLVCVAAALIDTCPCGMPSAWRVGALGCIVGAWLIDLSGARWSRLVFGLAVCAPMAWLNYHRAAWISPLFLVSGSGHRPALVVHGGSGMGIPGMRERAALLGGRLVAGPGRLGWLVECVLPAGAPTVDDPGLSRSART